MILDSDVVIDILRGQTAAVNWVNGLPESPTISGVAALEILFGAKDSLELIRLRRFLDTFPIVWPTAVDAELALSFASLRLSHGIGLLDAVTAALVLRLDTPVATFNIKHFVSVSGVKTIQPYTR